MVALVPSISTRKGFLLVLSRLTLPYVIILNLGIEKVAISSPITHGEILKGQ